MWELNPEMLFIRAIRFEGAVERLRQLLASLSRRGPDFELPSVYVRFLVDSVVGGRFFSSYFGFPLWI